MNEVQVIVSPKKAYELEQQFRIVKKSIDARQRELKVHLTLLADDQGHYVPLDSPLTPSSTNPLTGNPSPVPGTPSPVSIIGAGPAGLFAALTLIEHGIKPIIYERGKEVGERKKDIALLNRNMGLNPESNYCFGEGGAGTFSDGKLFSRSKKRGSMQHVMEIFHYFGASDRVLYETHAHIGSDRLPSIIRRIREYILAHGGEIHFKTDNTPLFDWSVGQLEAEGWQLSEVTHDLHADGPVGVMTDYEAKFYEQGMKINRLVAARTGGTKGTAAGEVPRLRNASLTDARGYEESQEANRRNGA